VVVAAVVVVARCTNLILLAAYSYDL